MNLNLHRKISVVQMAELGSMSLRNFQRVFTNRYGVTPKGYLQLKRVKKAKSLLHNTNFRFEEILPQIGIRDLSSFRKVFRRELGLTPSEFRRRIR